MFATVSKRLAASASQSLRKQTAVLTQVRNLNIHEYQSHALLNKFGVPTPKGIVATTAEEAETAAKTIGTDDYVVKAQILAGGRGRGAFDNGFKGGVHKAFTAKEAKDYANKMLGHHLITNQTGPQGRIVRHVFVVERVYARRELYFAILMDRVSGGPVIIGSTRGGMNIEEVARDTPEEIHKEYVDIFKGLQPEQVERMIVALGLNRDDKIRAEAVDVINKLFLVFMKNDCTLLEINPLIETPDKRVLCADAKLNFDDNAEFRQNEIFAQRDTAQEDPREVRASEFGLSYIGLEGNIGCIVNGAGLAMATMDIIKLKGGNPANFLDVGGGATEAQVVEAMKILTSDPNVRAILVNIFGGIMRCDLMASGIVKAAKEVGVTVPIVVRLQGTNVKLGQELIAKSGLRIITADDLEEAAMKAVKMADIVRMAAEIGVKLSFEA